MSLHTHFAAGHNRWSHLVVWVGLAEIGNSGRERVCDLGPGSGEGLEKGTGGDGRRGMMEVNW